MPATALCRGEEGVYRVFVSNAAERQARWPRLLGGTFPAWSRLIRESAAAFVAELLAISQQVCLRIPNCVFSHFLSRYV